MPKVSDEYRVAKRTEIAEAALRAFRKQGFHESSMADIIAESGLSAGAIYGHYASKSEIVVEVATRIVGRRLLDIKMLENAEPMPSPGALVAVLMRGMVADLGDTGIMVQLWGAGVTDSRLAALGAGVVDRLFGAYRAYISLWHQRQHGLEKAAADALAQIQAPVFVSVCQGFILQSAILEGFDAESFFASVEATLPR